MSVTKVQMGFINSVVTVPCSFIDHYMNTCPPVYALIYLYSFRRAQAGAETTIKTLSTHFNVLETDVHNAWRFWENAGLVTVEGAAPEVTITFLAPEQWEKAETPAAPTPTPAKIIVAERPGYTVEELTLLREKSKEVEQLFKHAEEMLGKLLTYHDMNVLFGFYDWLRLPVDVLAFLLAYCADHGHRDLRYIEKCALDWADRGIHTVEAAKEYTQGFDLDYRTILKAMGQNSGFPTKSQRKYIDKWRSEWNMSLTLIVEACDRAGLQIGTPKFTYVDKIIAAWFKAGITTMEGIAAADEEFTKTKTTATASKAVKAKPTRFANFTQRKNDNTTFEKMERAYLLKELQG